MIFNTLYEGQPIRLEVLECVIHGVGEFSHNLDCRVHFSQRISEEDVLHMLDIQPAGGSDRLSAIATGRDGDAITLTFDTKGHVDEPKQLVSVAIIWDDEKLGDVACAYVEVDDPPENAFQARHIAKEERPIALYLLIFGGILAMGLYLGGAFGF